MIDIIKKRYYPQKSNNISFAMGFTSKIKALIYYYKKSISKEMEKDIYFQFVDLRIIDFDGDFYTALEIFAMSRGCLYLVHNMNE